MAASKCIINSIRLPRDPFAGTSGASMTAIAQLAKEFSRMLSALLRGTTPSDPNVAADLDHVVAALCSAQFDVKETVDFHTVLLQEITPKLLEALSDVCAIGPVRRTQKTVLLCAALDKLIFQSFAQYSTLTRSSLGTTEARAIRRQAIQSLLRTLLSQWSLELKSSELNRFQPVDLSVLLGGTVSFDGAKHEGEGESESEGEGEGGSGEEDSPGAESGVEPDLVLHAILTILYRVRKMDFIELLEEIPAKDAADTAEREGASTGGEGEGANSTDETESAPKTYLSKFVMLLLRTILFGTPRNQACAFKLLAFVSASCPEKFDMQSLDSLLFGLLSSASSTEGSFASVLFDIAGYALATVAHPGDDYLSDSDEEGWDSVDDFEEAAAWFKKEGQKLRGRRDPSEEESLLDLQGSDIEMDVDNSKSKDNSADELPLCERGLSCKRGKKHRAAFRHEPTDSAQAAGKRKRSESLNQPPKKQKMTDPAPPEAPAPAPEPESRDVADDYAIEDHSLFQSLLWLRTPEEKEMIAETVVYWFREMLKNRHWAPAISDLISRALAGLPSLVAFISSQGRPEEEEVPTVTPDELQRNEWARYRAIAALAIIGGLDAKLHEGAFVRSKEESQRPGTVDSVVVDDLSVFAFVFSNESGRFSLKTKRKDFIVAHEMVPFEARTKHTFLDDKHIGYIVSILRQEALNSQEGTTVAKQHTMALES